MKFTHQAIGPRMANPGQQRGNRLPILLTTKKITTKRKERMNTTRRRGRRGRREQREVRGRR